MRVRAVGGQCTLLHLRELKQLSVEVSALNHCLVLELEFLAVTHHAFEYFIFVDNHRLNVIFLFNINN